MNSFGFGILASLAVLGAATALPAQEQDAGLNTVISSCVIMKRQWEKGDKQTAINVMSQLDPEMRKAVAVICRSVSTGYDAGRQDALANLS